MLQKIRNRKLNPFIFGFFIISYFLTGYLTGSGKTALKPAGALAGSLGAVIGIVAVFLIMRKIFPKTPAMSLPGKILGIITLILGVAVSLIFMFLLWGTEPNTGMILFIILLILWVLTLIRSGMETPLFLSFLAGGIAGGLLYSLAVTGIPALYPRFYFDPDFAGESAETLRILYAVLGAYTGAFGTSAARASGLGLTEPKTGE